MLNMQSFEENHSRFRKSHSDDDTKGPTAPFYEQQAFDSIFQALRWEQVRTRVPICLRKTTRSRYMLADLVFLGYAIGILMIDFDPSLSELPADSVAAEDGNLTTTALTATVDESVANAPLITHLYIGKLSLARTGVFGRIQERHQRA